MWTSSPDLSEEKNKEVAVLTELELEKYADIIIWGLKTARTGKFAKNDVVLLQYDPLAITLAEIVYGKLLDLGLNPVQRMGMTYGMEQTFYRKAKKNQLIFTTPGEKDFYENLHGRIYLRAPESLTHLKDIDPIKIGKFLISRKPFRDILEKREAKGLHGWTLCTVPTSELATQARATMEEYTAQIIKACYLDKNDPVKEWELIHKDVRDIKKWLNSLKIEHLHVESKNVDLKITPGEHRKWAGVSGHNLPSFEIFLSPDWRGTEGTYYANLPSFRSGNYVESVRIVFRKGKAVKIAAESGGDFAEKQMSIDKGASRLGEFSLTDKRFSRIDRFMADTLFDENFGGDNGNVHVAMGSSYSDTYAGNQEDMTKELKQKLGFNDSALHWDLVNTEDKTVTAHLTTGQKKVIYENGMFRNGY
ncbi:MAG: aminopeptidase [Syntrophobacterales bacterium]|jgi:aminopeptidase|nr:aminopeptidase [Syntrophobacterales bacterium]